ncbi:MAG: 3-dehydroquinate synthase [Planctomycetota bacterium]
MAESIKVELGERSYEILIIEGMEGFGLALQKRLRPSLVLLVADETVAGLYAPSALSSLSEAGIKAALVPFPPGEASKSLSRASLLYDAFFRLRADRKSVVAALGGGVTGDLAGFAAATFMRGIPYVQVPTTVLAQVDSSVGDKTGVNHPAGKNMIGCFHQPSLVYTDLATLRTLPEEEFACGMAEVVKHGVIRDATYFEYIETHLDAIRAMDMACLREAIGGSCRIKAGVVAADERESGLRAILNFGHTVGHALEALTDFTGYRHGEAVSIGMMAACRLAEALLGFPASESARIAGLLKRIGLPTSLTGLKAEAVLDALVTDKKAEYGTLRFVLPRRIGEVCILPVKDKGVVRAAIQAVSFRSA